MKGLFLRYPNKKFVELEDLVTLKQDSKKFKSPKQKRVLLNSLEEKKEVNLNRSMS